jgi:hypothetical protein
MAPYVIRQGDYLAKLASKFGFDADAVWTDDKNTALKELRKDPNILFPGDVLYIPDATNDVATPTSLKTGTSNDFTSSPPTVPITHKFLNPCFASQPYIVHELPDLTGLTTDGGGTATFSVPVTLETITLVFTATGQTFVYDIGALDPIQTASGVFQRLQSLGFIDPSVTFNPGDPSQLGLVKSAVRAFLAGPPSSGATPSTTANASPADSSPPSSPPSGWSLWADSSPESSPPSSAPPSSGTPASSPPSSAPASDPSPASAPASARDSTPPGSGPSSSPPSSGSGDGSHVNDDGTLDDDTRQKLYDAHGS